MTLSEVIAAATARHNALLIAGDTDVANRHDYIAAAVAAHLTSEAVVERAAQVLCERFGSFDPAEDMTVPVPDDYTDQARAAIRAALRCDDA